MNVYEYNGKAAGMANEWYQKVWMFSINEFWKNIGCLVSAPTFGIGGSRLLEKEEDTNLSGKNRKRLSIWIKIDLHPNLTSLPILSADILCLFLNPLPKTKVRS